MEAWPARERPVRERPILAEVHGEQNITARGLRVGVALGKGGNEVSSTRATEVVRQSSFASNQASFAGNENQRAIVDPEPWAKAVGRPPPPVAQAVPVNNRQTVWCSQSYTPLPVDTPAPQMSRRQSPPRRRYPSVVRVMSGCEDMFGIHSGARHQSPTPREVLERRLTAPEKVNFAELQLLESLGSGEFGQVFRGLYHGTEVAIKQLYMDESKAPNSVLQDLSKEVESFRHLRHKRLVSFVGACFDIPHPCIITEYMPGGSLHYFLHVNKKKLSVVPGTNMCLQLSDAVQYLHGLTPVIVHRDLKSLNVVLDLSLNLKVCDFGLAESVDRTRATRRNNGGSPRYMAPELFQSGVPITEKVDIWAMGCIFSEIFTCRLPYMGIDTLEDLMREMLINRRGPGLPEGLDTVLQDVIRSCHAFEQWRRPTAAQIFARLRDRQREVKHIYNNFR